MQATRLATRLQRELRMLQSDPPPGVCAWPCNDSLSHLEAQIQGPDGTVYERGLFKLEIRVPDRYPFEPPSVRFKTPIYHPNVDSGGRICLDILNMPPKGAWKPSLNIPTILASIGLLLAEPNPDDGLMGEITAEYKHDRLSFDMTATKWTQQYALQKDSVDGGDSVRIPVQHDGVQQKTSISAVKVSAPAALSGLETQDNRLQESTTGLQEAQTSSSENGTKATNKLGKCSVGSTSKLVLGAKLSLEKGSKDSGKRSYINTADADISAVTSKRALSCIDNTVGTRQVTVQKSQPLESSMDIAKVKGTGNDTHEHPSGDSPELYPKRDKVNNLKPESVKSRICVASDARPVRIPLTCRAVDRVFLLEKNQVCQSDHAATSTVQKGSLEISERRLTSSISPVSISSKKAVPAYMLDDNYERSGESRREAGHLKNVHSSIIGSDSESNQRDRYFAAAPVVRGCAPPLIPVANASRDASVADHESTASGLVQNNLKSRSKCLQGTNADIVWITGESSAGKKGSIAGVDRLDMARKPSKPATNVIVLDSESDDEPPKGRSRLSLSRRRGVKDKMKD